MLLILDPGSSLRYVRDDTIGGSCSKVIFMKISTDKNLIEEFLTRGVEQIYPTVDVVRKKLLSGERLKIYQGFDPTGPHLHVGHAIGIRALAILQKLGHEVIFLVGDFTAKIGDPDKDATREILTDDKIEKNMAGWKKQVGQLIDFDGDNSVKFKKNSEWLSDLKLEDMIRLMSKITVQRMLHRDLFKRRIKNEEVLMLHEFLYPLLQGYDSVAMEIDMEIAGADQTFNTLVGRDLSKIYLKKEKFVRTNKMMAAPVGETMSKTKGNGINLSDTPQDMYGKAMSYPDNLITTGLELLTNVPMDEIKNIETQIKEGANPMSFKKLMAREIVKTIKGDTDAQIGQEHFEKTVQKKEKPQSIENVQLSTADWKLIDLLVELKLASSKSEARRLIEQGGVKIDDNKINDVDCELTLTSKDILIQKGKRGFVNVSKK